MFFFKILWNRACERTYLLYLLPILPRYPIIRKYSKLNTELFKHCICIWKFLYWNGDVNEILSLYWKYWKWIVEIFALHWTIFSMKYLNTITKVFVLHCKYRQWNAETLNLQWQYLPLIYTIIEILALYWKY